MNKKQYLKCHRALYPHLCDQTSMIMLLGRSFGSWRSLGQRFHTARACILIPAKIATGPLAVNVNVRASFVQGKRYFA